MTMQLLSQAPGLTTGGLIVMIVCVGGVCGLMTFCYYRLLRQPRPSDHHHAPLDIDTHDTD